MNMYEFSHHDVIIMDSNTHAQVTQPFECHFVLVGETVKCVNQFNLRLCMFLLTQDVFFFVVANRERTHKVYEIFSRKPPAAVWETLNSMKVTHVVIDTQWCLGRPK